MNEQKHVDCELDSAEWYIAEVDKLLKQYYACKTEYARNLLRPKLDACRGKLSAERRGVEKYIPDEFKKSL